MIIILLYYLTKFCKFLLFFCHKIKFAFDFKDLNLKIETLSFSLSLYFWGKKKRTQNLQFFAIEL